MKVEVTIYGTGRIERGAFEGNLYDNVRDAVTRRDELVALYGTSQVVFFKKTMTINGKLDQDDFLKRFAQSLNN